MSAGAIQAIERLLAEAVDADDVLRGAVSALAAEPGVVWAGIGFVEAGALALGPAAGMPDEARRARIAIVYQGELVGELWADGDPDLRLLEHAAELIASHVLIGWDTRGEAWDP